MPAELASPLEDETTESLAWQAEQDTAAQDYLRALPAYEHFRRQLSEGIVGAQAYPMKRAGGRWFQEFRLAARSDQPAIVVRDVPTAEPRVLVDPDQLSSDRGAPVSLFWYAPSPNGEVLAFALMVAGDEKSEVLLLDVASGGLLADEVPYAPIFEVSWLADSSGFYCGDQKEVDGELQTTVWRYQLGQASPDHHEDAPTGLLFPAPVVSADGRYVGIRTGNTSPRMEYLRTGDGPWLPFLRDVAGASLGEFHGNDYFAIVDGGHPRGRLVRIPIATAADPGTWTELVPESDEVLRWVKVVGAHIVLGYLHNAACGLRVLDLDGSVITEVKVPGIGAIDVYAAGATQLLFPMFFAGEGELSFIFSTPTSSFALYRYVVATDELEEISPADRVEEGLVVRQIIATSADGTQVPATVVHPADLDLSVSHPTLLHGYGGYSVGMLPAYRGTYTEFVKAGGVFVLAHLRGGSELGADWWLAGRRDRKQNTFNDLYAVAERLIEDGLTTPAQLAVEGGSNGGTMAGAAVVQRPDLWAVVVSHVPQLDLLMFHRDPVGYAIASVEYGDPQVPEEAEWLRTLSPRHGITAWTAYPAVLVSAGATDPRCPPWHSRVFAAELREATTSEAPILLRVHTDQGHGPSDRSRAIEQNAEWLAFVADRTGLRVTRR